MTHPFRFVHAAHLAVDQPLCGCGPLSDAARETVRDATYLAFEALCDACIERDARFLLVTGRIFGDDEPTIRSLKALRDGFERLDAAGIFVFVAPGEAPSHDSWHSPASWPENVTILRLDSEDSVAVIDEDNILATIEFINPADHAREYDDAPAEPNATPLRIGVSPDLPPGHSSAVGFDYVAIDGGDRPKTAAATRTVFHHPGSVQGLAAHESGPHGATLVAVQDDATLALHPLPLAPVRWERLFVDVSDGLDEHELIEQMRTVLEQCETEPGEQVWIVEWTLEGAGPLLTTLARDEAARSDVIEQLGALVVHPRQLLHRIRCTLESGSLRDGLDGDAVATRLLDELEQTAALTGGIPQHPPQGIAPERLAAALAACEADEILERARRNLAQWLDGQGEAA